jgi:hypothetical protein
MPIRLREVDSLSFRNVFFVENKLELGVIHYFLFDRIFCAAKRFLDLFFALTFQIKGPKLDLSDFYRIKNAHGDSICHRRR